MVLVSPSMNPKACWEFEGEILVLHHPTTISVKYQAMGSLIFIHTVFLKLLLSSALRPDQTNGDDHSNVERVPANGRQGPVPLPLH